MSKEIVIEWDGRDGLAGLARLVFSGYCGTFIIYRGHASADWKLVPGLYRHGPQDRDFDEAMFMVGEMQLLNAFFARGAMMIADSKRNTLNDLVIAQHYGVPTRLLDWSSDPMIAIYFAVEDESEQDAALFCMDAVRWLGPFDRVSTPYVGPIVRINPPMIDNRIIAQKSVFSLQSFGEGPRFQPLEDRDHDVDSYGAHNQIWKIVIPGIKKRQILLDLMTMGIDASMVYPGLDGIGKRLAALTRAVGYGNDIY